MNNVVRYPKLYAWTTELYQTKNWLKIGDTMFDVDSRIINTDTTGMAEPPIKKLDYDLEITNADTNEGNLFFRYIFSVFL